MRKENQMKKLLSVLLTLAMMISMLSVGASAANVETVERLADAQEMIVEDLGQAQVSTELVKTVAHDQRLLEKAALSSLVEIGEVASDGDVIYEIPYEWGTEYITVAEGEQGNIVLNITDGDKEDELVYTNDGRILLNGNEVIVEDQYALDVESNDVSALTADTNGIQPYAGVYRQYKAATHTFKSGVSYAPDGFKATGAKFTGKTISYTQVISTLTASAFISILCSAVSPLLPTIMSAALSAADALSIVQAAINAKQTELALLAGQCSATSVNVDVIEYAKTTNNSLYSVFHYNIATHLTSGNSYSASRYSFEAT